MQESYNNASYARISATDESLFIPECVNWNLINSSGSMPTNYRERLMTDNNDNSNSSYIDDSNVPSSPIYIQKRHQLKLKRNKKFIYIYKHITFIKYLKMILIFKIFKIIYYLHIIINILIYFILLKNFFNNFIIIYLFILSH